MDKSVMMKAMKDSISEVLEQMFFMPVDFIAADAVRLGPESDDALIIAKLGFSGSPCGTFMLLMPKALAKSVSADFLGAALQNLSNEQVTETVLEMVNMLAGSALSLYDHCALFDLQIPELITFSEVCALTKGVPDQVVIGVQTPESRMTFQLIIQ